MKRKPKVGDIVFIAPLRGNIQEHHIRECVVLRVGREYFHTAICSFEIDSYTNGAWLDKKHSTGHMHEVKAYLLRDVFEKQKTKKKMINAILSCEMLDWSCAKVRSVYEFINAMDNMENAEEWEL